MPSHPYDPPNRDDAAEAPDDTAGQRPGATAARPDQTAAMPGQGDPAQSAPPGQLMPPATSSWSGRQPTERTSAGEGQPGSAPPAAPAYGGGPGWTQPEEHGPPGQHDHGGYPSQGDREHHADPYQQDAYQEQDPNRSPDGASALDGDAVRAREKEAFGGVKVGAAFFGWLTAVGATVILVAVVAAVASALDLSTTVDGSTSSQDPSTLGLTKIIAGLVILFVAYYCGGYVAGRMARFNGARQGVAVWLWAVILAAILTLIGVLFDTNSDLAQNVSLPDFRVDFDTVTAETLIAIGIVLGVTLIGAIIGGLTGMRFHRRVDRAGFASDPY